MSPGLEPEHRDKPGHPPYRSHSPTLPASVIGTPAGTKVVRPWGAPPWPHRRSVKRTRPQSRPYLTTEEKNLYHASLTGVPATDKRIMTASWASRRKFTCSQLPAPDPVASCSSGAEPSGIASRVVLLRGAAIAPPAEPVFSDTCEALGRGVTPHPIEGSRSRDAGGRVRPAWRSIRNLLAVVAQGTASVRVGQGADVRSST
jgi:hypothetical protein